MSKEAVKKITAELGTEAIQEALDVSSHSVRAARTSGVFPASWYGPLLSLCRERGIDCPLEAFNWRDGNAA
jgi:hypothetical protein